MNYVLGLIMKLDLDSSNCEELVVMNVSWNLLSSLLTHWIVNTVNTLIHFKQFARTSYIGIICMLKSSPVSDFNVLLNCLKRKTATPNAKKEEKEEAMSADGDSKTEDKVDGKDEEKSTPAANEEKKAIETTSNGGSAVESAPVEAEPEKQPESKQTAEEAEKPEEKTTEDGKE